MLKLFVHCEKCKTSHFISFLKMKGYVCSRCGHHLRISSTVWKNLLCDRKGFREIDAGLTSQDPLGFPGYREKTARARKETRLGEAVITAECNIGGHPAGIGIMESHFIMASMGSVLGEKITRLLEFCRSQSIPAVIVIASGGARMQEGILSLMQMAKTAAAVNRLNQAGLPLFTVLTHPTTGGVTASFAMLGNVIIAEPGALIGFAGPRVIRQTINRKLPEGFQRSEFLLKHGMVDMICHRKELKKTLEKLLGLHARRPTAHWEKR